MSTPASMAPSRAIPEILHDPERDATTLPLIREAVRRDLPMLAICRGIQELNVALGGTLHQRVHELPGRLNHRSRKDSPDGPYGPAHSVALTPGGLSGIACRNERDHGQFAALAGHRSPGPEASGRGGRAGRADRGGEPARGAICRRRAMAPRIQGAWKTRSRALCFAAFARACDAAFAGAP